MKSLVVKSGQFNNCPDIYEKFYFHSSTSKEKEFIQKITKHRRKYDARVTHRKVQTVWEKQLPLQRRKQARADLLPVCQYTGCKDCFNLRVYRKQGNYRRGARKLSKSPSHYRRNQRYQSRAIVKKSQFLKRKLEYLKWIHTP